MSKKLLFLITLFIFTIQIKAQVFRKAEDYMDYISRQQVLIVKSSWRYTQAVAHSKNDRTISKKRTYLLNL